MEHIRNMIVMKGLSPVVKHIDKLDMRTFEHICGACCPIAECCELAFIAREISHVVLMSAPDNAPLVSRTPTQNLRPTSLWCLWHGVTQHRPFYGPSKQVKPSLLHYWFREPVFDAFAAIGFPISALLAQTRDDPQWIRDVWIQGAKV
jgi:hypothetical protein